MANGGGRAAEPRKLAAIISGEPKSLTLPDLEAIDNFLRPFGQSLADLPLLDADTITRALVELEEVVFFMASRHVNDREFVSVWDIRVYSAIAERIRQRWPKTRVILREEQGCQLVEKAHPQPDWSSLIADAEASYCCLGAPLAFGLAEHMLALMFNVPPFKPLPKAGHRLPFHFIWYPPPGEALENASVPSHFVLSADDLTDLSRTPAEKELAEAVRQRRAQAFLLEGQIYPVRLDQAQWKDYGVIVAQRRKKGQLWVVVAGLSGPSTLAAAKLLDAIRLDLPESGVGDVSPPIYAVVESAVRTSPRKASGERRELLDQKLLVGPKVWESPRA